jgi:hypothetical protein
MKSTNVFNNFWIPFSFTVGKSSTNRLIMYSSPRKWPPNEEGTVTETSPGEPSSILDRSSIQASCPLPIVDMSNIVSLYITALSAWVFFRGQEYSASSWMTSQRCILHLCIQKGFHNLHICSLEVPDAEDLMIPFSTLPTADTNMFCTTNSTSIT